LLSWGSLCKCKATSTFLKLVSSMGVAQQGFILEAQLAVVTLKHPFSE